MMQLLQLIKRDLIYGFRINVLHFIFISIMISFLGAVNIYNFSQWATLNDISLNQVNTLDILYESFKGIGYEYEIPIVWLFINCYVIFLIGNYTYNDLFNNGPYLILRSNSKLKLWISKLVWIVCTVLFFYMVVFLIVILISIFFIPFQIDSWSVYGEQNILPLMAYKIEGSTFILELICLYVTSSIAISIFQVFLSFIFNSIYSYISVIVLLFASIFIFSPYLPGTHSMIMRHTLFDTSYNLSFEISILYNSILILLSSTIGAVYFNRVDIVFKNNN
ncbi:hypothetical protein [Bacillus manliponensis]|uniref:hypothetical protein n=1 Tax=Bacillus manliponensis TaxID=574376 RepID=UPI003511E478